MTEGRKRWMPAAVLAMAAVLVCVVLGAVWGWRTSVDTWAQLEEVESELQPPPELAHLETRRDGTPICVVSCNEARLVSLFRSASGVRETCDAVEQMLTGASHESVLVQGHGFCNFGGPADDVGDLPELGITATVFPADEVASDDNYWYPWVQRHAQSAPGALLVEVSINSGID